MSKNDILCYTKTMSQVGLNFSDCLWKGGRFSLSAWLSFNNCIQNLQFCSIWATHFHDYSARNVNLSSSIAALFVFDVKFTVSKLIKSLVNFSQLTQPYHLKWIRPSCRFPKTKLTDAYDKYSPQISIFLYENNCDDSTKSLIFLGYSLVRCTILRFDF